MFYSFSGGIKPFAASYAEPSVLTPAPMPEAVRIAPSSAGYSPAVKKGDAVFMGTPLFSPPGPAKTPLFSPVSGTVEEVSANGILLRSDYAEALSPACRPFSGSVRDASPKELIAVIERCGVPYRSADNALSAFLDGYCGKLRHVILNLAEPDPRSVSFAMTASAYTTEVLGGMKLLLRILGVRQAAVLVPSDDPGLMKVLRKTANESPFFAFHTIASKYPAANERLAAALVRGKTPDPACSVADSGIAVFTPDVPLSVCRAFASGIPAVTRIVTVCGDCIRKPVTLEAPVGMSFRDLCEACGSLRRRPAMLASGNGALCGVSEEAFDGVVRGDTSVLAVSADPEHSLRESSGRPAPRLGAGCCNGCGRCVRSCPAGLLPDRLIAVGDLLAEEAAAIRDGKGSADAFRSLLSESERLGAYACLGCGCCTYVCPAGLDVKSGVCRLHDLILKGDEPNDR